MDLPELAATVASIMAGQLRGLGESVIDRARGDASAALYRLAAARLRNSLQGAQSLAAVEADPSDRDRLDQLAQTLDEEVRRDPEFGGQLRYLVQQAEQTGQRITGAGATAVGNMNMSATGNLTNTNSILAGAGAIVSQVRATRINTGGIVAIIVVAILSISTGATVVADQLVETPSEVTDSFLEAYLEGDVTRFRSVTCANLQDEIRDSVEALQTIPTELEGEWKVLGEERSGGHATVRVEVTIRSRNDPDIEEQKETISIELVDEGGWKICGAY